MKLVQATLDLLRQSGLGGAGINQVVEVSRAPKGSVYHYFPGGKRQLVTEALREADGAIGSSFQAIFRADVPMGEKVRTLFAKTATGIEANAFMKGCPVAAVTLDLSGELEALREVCRGVFAHWIDVIAEGLEEIPARERRAVAQLIFATLEGGLILARAYGAKAPLIEAGASLALVLEARFPGRPRRRPPRSH
jgi:TetR/AcrR family transcriptional repressor of lmrAB and yxaGH operons